MAEQHLDNGGIDLKHGVCTITVGDKKGTGFHYGNGWVMSNTHVFQSNVGNNGFSQSLVNEATFTFNVNGNVSEFEPHDRMAFVHHLSPGNVANLKKDVDMAMVKLGRQRPYGNPRTEEWETEENQQLNHLPTFADHASLQATVTVGSPVEALYPFVDPAGECEIVTTECRISQIQGNAAQGNDAQGNAAQGNAAQGNAAQGNAAQGNAAQGNAAQGPVVLKLASTANTDPNLWPLIPGTSGCPIVIRQNGGRCLLVGIHYAGDKTSSYALQLSNGKARSCLDGGVEIFPDVEAYLLFKGMGDNARANSNKLNFLRIAKKLQLSIYTNNGEIYQPYIRQHSSSNSYLPKVAFAILLVAICAYIIKLLL